ncbi:MAG: type II secretion system protein [bacterium]
MAYERRAFTLVELLVVVAIIALLMAILSPALTLAKQRARAVVCQSNLQQWGVVFSMYTNEHHGRFFEGAVPAGVDDSARGRWMDALRWYYSNQPKIRCCPTASKTQFELNDAGEQIQVRQKGTFVAWGVFDGSSWTTKGDYGSYGLNRWVTNPLAGVSPRDRPTEYNWRTCDVPCGSDIPMFLDCHWVGGWPELASNEPPKFDGDWDSGRVNNIKRFCLNRHNGATNGLFMDLSIRRVGLKELWKLKWHREYDINAAVPVWPEWMRNFKGY